MLSGFPSTDLVFETFTVRITTMTKRRKNDRKYCLVGDFGFAGIQKRTDLVWFAESERYSEHSDLRDSDLTASSELHNPREEL